MDKRVRTKYIALIALLLLVIGVPAAVIVGRQLGSHSSALPIAPAPANLHLPATGLDYYEPTGYFTKCPDWSWLANACYKPRLPAGGQPAAIPSRVLLTSDLAFVRTAHLGNLLRVWISLDQLMRWNPQRGFDGFIPSRLDNLDDALRDFAAHGVTVDLVLFVYARGQPWINQFHPEALDGRHPQMQAGYLRALSMFVRRLAHNPVDAATVRIIDLQTEPYYQLEQYFTTPASLGSFQNCAGSAGTVMSSCVDQEIVHPWLEAMYRQARSASQRFLYTESDTGRLLSTNPSLQRYWMSMYPVDIYDIHMYDSSPWRDGSRWTTALHLQKPWIAGEVGCASGDAACTYEGQIAAPVDHWWLSNLQLYRAQAVLVESHVTLWSYRYGYNSQRLTMAGFVLECRTDPTLTACRNSRL